ncbi:MAG: hypothetical protein IJV69_06205 [Kiritimatiellae bacterium]|nr:hypothetical protein [Kiritimatiellia bacterium]
MGFFKTRRYSLRGSGKDGFRLQTRDVSDRRSFFSNRKRRETLSRLLESGGTHATRIDPEAYPIRRSWERFVTVMTLIIVLWLLGMFWP